MSKRVLRLSAKFVISGQLWQSPVTIENEPMHRLQSTRTVSAFTASLSVPIQHFGFADLTCFQCRQQTVIATMVINIQNGAHKRVGNTKKNW